MEETVKEIELASIIITAAKKRTRGGDGKEDVHSGPAGETCLARAWLTADSRVMPSRRSSSLGPKGELVLIKEILEDSGHESPAADVFGFSECRDRASGARWSPLHHWMEAPSPWRGTCRLISSQSREIEPSLVLVQLPDGTTGYRSTSSVTPKGTLLDREAV